MNLDILRKIDFWVGVPACFLLSLANSVGRCLGGRGENRPPRKVLFIKLYEMGSIIMAYPLIRQVRADHPSAELFILTFENNRGVLRLLDDIIPPGNIFAIRRDKAFLPGDLLAAVRKIRREDIDVVFDLEFFSRYSAVLSFLVGPRQRVGFFRYGFEGLYRGDLMTHKVQYNPLIHMSRCYLSLGQVIRQPGKGTPEMEYAVEEGEPVWPVHRSEPAVRERVKERLRQAGIADGLRVFLLHPGDGFLPVREWPLDHFIALSERILKTDGNRVVLVGTEDASKKAAMIIKALGDERCVDFTGRTSLEELMELMGLSAALVTHDSGMAHLAMFSTMRTFVIFGPESPQVFAPLGERITVLYSNWPCSPCLSVLNHRHSFCRDNRCLKAVSPDDVFAVVREACQG